MVCLLLDRLGVRPLNLVSLRDPPVCGFSSSTACSSADFPADVLERALWSSFELLSLRRFIGFFSWMARTDKFRPSFC
jgi:hypothetical protein